MACLLSPVPRAVATWSALPIWPTRCRTSRAPRRLRLPSAGTITSVHLVGARCQSGEHRTYRSQDPRAPNVVARFDHNAANDARVAMRLRVARSASAVSLWSGADADRCGGARRMSPGYAALRADPSFSGSRGPSPRSPSHRGAPRGCIAGRPPTTHRCQPRVAGTNTTLERVTVDDPSRFSSVIVAT